MVDAAASLGEVSEQAGVAPEVELDRGLGGVLRFGNAEDFFGGED